jgi:putative chitinase
MRAIIEYQRLKGLKPDGVIGKITLNAIKQDCNIKSDIELAHFMGQCHHETGGFRAVTENLNYSADGLITTFRSDFDINKNRIIEANERLKANQLARNPKAIANFVYANQNGNGNEASGDGWLYRGRGAIQLTGRANYQLFARYVNDPEVMINPDIVATKYFFKSADFFFDRNKLWDIAKQGTTDAIITQLTRRINGATKGLQDRIVQTKHYLNILQ